MKMKVEKVLVELEKLLRTWGIETSDWILVANYAYKLMGYDVKLRRGHLNVLVKKNEIPWQIEEGVEVHPPRNTKYRNDFRKFIDKTGFDFDINLATNREFEQKKGMFILYELPNGIKIRVQIPLGALREFEKLLSLSTREGLGVERLSKDIDYIQNLIEALLKKKEKTTARKFQELLKRFKKAKKRHVISRLYEGGIISGIVASRGYVRGKVVKVEETEEINKLSDGDILVTKMTSPTLLVVLPRIKAIVTDWGGMLSHAAILARELKIPCIVGTQIATQVLKDGDLIEVDANRGVVRKLNNEKN